MYAHIYIYIYTCIYIPQNEARGRPRLTYVGFHFVCDRGKHRSAERYGLYTIVYLYMYN